jgi:hypothetical protein
VKGTAPDDRQPGRWYGLMGYPLAVIGAVIGIGLLVVLFLIWHGSGG